MRDAVCAGNLAMHSCVNTNLVRLGQTKLPRGRALLMGAACFTTSASDLPAQRSTQPAAAAVRAHAPAASDADARPDVSICLREPLLRGGASLLQPLPGSLKTPTFGDTDGQCPGTRGITPLSWMNPKDSFCSLEAGSDDGLPQPGHCRTRTF